VCVFVCVCVRACVRACTGRGSDAGGRLPSSPGNQRNFSNVLYVVTFHTKHYRALTFENASTPLLVHQRGREIC
jgi:hypothetical protein